MKKVHFIGVCGAGMSAVAKLLLDAGCEVSGSDEGFYPPISEVIQRYGFQTFNGYRPENIPADCDTIVIGKHAKLVPSENEEVRAAFASGKQVLSFPAVLSQLTQNTQNYIFAGSFGKSSCTALATWALMHAGRDPSYFIGAEAKDLPDNGHLSQSSTIFVLEGDEYPAANDDSRSKFLFYHTKYLLITSGEHDHVNVFPTIEDYLAPFEQLAAQVPMDGLLVLCDHGVHLDRVVSNATAPTLWYGLEKSPRTAWWAEEFTVREGRTYFTLTNQHGPVVQIETGLLGRHNAENIVGVGAVLLETGALTPTEFATGMQTFSGVKRRLERLTPLIATTPVYNDFGSSRAKCRAGIEAILEAFPNRDLVVCFEPHTFSFRNKDAIAWYDTLFAGCRTVYVYQPPAHGASTHNQLTQAEIVARIAQSGVHVVGIESADALLAHLEASTNLNTSLLLFESSGDFGGAIPRVANFFGAG
jgi:UDP-N-acetylmuramate: L-alanyl-gamma-D-glutamyl-meso-diaminopimelate ligase